MKYEGDFPGVVDCIKNSVNFLTHVIFFSLLLVTVMYANEV